MARALPSPRFFCCFCFQALARSLERRNRLAASPKAQRRCALPIFLPPEPSALPADSWAQRTSRQYDRNCPQLAKRLTSWTSDSSTSASTLPTPGMLCSRWLSLHVIDLGGPRQVQLQRGDLLVEAVDDGQVGAGVALDAGVSEARGAVHLGAVGGEGQLLGEGREVVLGVE